MVKIVAIHVVVVVVVVVLLLLLVVVVALVAVAVAVVLVLLLFVWPCNWHHLVRSIDRAPITSSATWNKNQIRKIKMHPS